MTRTKRNIRRTVVNIIAFTLLLVFAIVVKFML